MQSLKVHEQISVSVFGISTTIKDSKSISRPNCEKAPLSEHLTEFSLKRTVTLASGERAASASVSSFSSKLPSSRTSSTQLVRHVSSSSDIRCSLIFSLSSRPVMLGAMPVRHITSPFSSVNDMSMTTLYNSGVTTMGFDCLAAQVVDSDASSEYLSKACRELV